MPTAVRRSRPVSGLGLARRRGRYFGTERRPLPSDLGRRRRGPAGATRSAERHAAPGATAPANRMPRPVGDAGHRRLGGGQGRQGTARLVGERRRPDVDTVGPRAPAPRRVHDHLHLARGDQLDGVGSHPLFADLGDERSHLATRRKPARNPAVRRGCWRARTRGLLQAFRHPRGRPACHDRPARGTPSPKPAAPSRPPSGSWRTRGRTSRRCP